MSSTQRLLRTNTGAPDGSLFSQGYQYSLFKYQPWDTYSDKVREVVRVDPPNGTTGISPGSKVSFAIEKIGTYLEDVKLKIYWDAIVKNGVGTYARAIDYLGIGSVKKVTVRAGNHILGTLEPYDYFTKNVRDHSISKLDNFDELLAGNLTPAQRNSKAAAPQVTTLYLKPTWYGLPGHSPIFGAIANQIKFDVELAPNSDIIQTDHPSASFSISGIEMILQTIQTTGSERDVASKLSFTGEGIQYLDEIISSTQTDRLEATPSTTRYKISLREKAVLPLHSIYFTIQPADDLELNWQKKPFEIPLYPLNDIEYVRLADGKREIELVNGVDEFMDQFQKKHCMSVWRFPQGFFSFSERADIKNENTGSIDPINLQNFQVEIKFKSPLLEDMIVSFSILQHNWHVHQGGEIQNIFD